MILGGQWVSLEVMNTIFALWAVAVVIIVVLLLWFRCGGCKKHSSARGTHIANPEKHNKRKKR